jgi:hypothetical protein
MASDEHREWIRVFFEGTWLVAGWNARTAPLFEAVPPAEVPALRARVDRLGQRIAPEWAKDNDVRRIGNGELESWGRRLVAARDRGSRGIDAELSAIEREVEQRLA